MMCKGRKGSEWQGYEGRSTDVIYTFFPDSIILFLRDTINKANDGTQDIIKQNCILHIT